MPGRINNDDLLIALLEQAEVIAEAWTASLPTWHAERDESCPSAETLQQFVAGALQPEQATTVAAHLGDCPHCRAETRQWRLLRDAESGQGTCDLAALREIMRREPGPAARALVRISRRVTDMVVPQPPEQSTARQVELGVFGPAGEFSGEWLSVAIDRAHIDARYRLCLRMQASEAGHEGYRLRLFLKNGLGRIEVGAITLAEGATTAAVDLSDLYVKPGYMPLGAVELLAEHGQIQPGQVPAALVETSAPSAPVIAQSATTDTLGQTMTAANLAGISRARPKRTSMSPATEKPPARRKTTGRQEDE